MMFRLRGTLVATSRMRPWRNGWSADRGVEFSLASRTAGPTSRAEDVARAEPRSFIDEDWGPPRAAAGLVGPAAGREHPDDAADTGTVRGWWSLAGKPSRT